MQSCASVSKDAKSIISSSKLSSSLRGEGGTCNVRKEIKLHWSWMLKKAFWGRESESFTRKTRYQLYLLLFLGRQHLRCQRVAELCRGSCWFCGDKIRDFQPLHRFLDELVQFALSIFLSASLSMSSHKVLLKLAPTSYYSTLVWWSQSRLNDQKKN